MRHSTIQSLPLPEKAPSFLLSKHGSSLHRKVEQIQDRHPDWAPEALRRALFRQGLTAPLDHLREFMDDSLENMLPLRLVKARLREMSF